MPQEGKIAKTMTSNGKQFTVTRKILTAVDHDQSVQLKVAGILAHFSKFTFVFYRFDPQFGQQLLNE